METVIYYVLFTINIYVKRLESLKTIFRYTYNISKFDCMSFYYLTTLNLK